MRNSPHTPLFAMIKYADSVSRMISSVVHFCFRGAFQKNRGAFLGGVVQIQRLCVVLCAFDSFHRDNDNYSAHKNWYNSTKQDIEPHILKYRVIIEVLMYKAGVK